MHFNISDIDVIPVLESKNLTSSSLLWLKEKEQKTIRGFLTDDQNQSISIRTR